MALVLALVISHLDYGNAIYYGLPKSTLAPLCHIQSMAVKMILKKRKYNSVMDVMIALHWLPIPYRSEFKIAFLVYQSLKGQAPCYLQEHLSVRDVSRITHSGTSGTVLNIPATKRKTFADRPFAVAGPKIWNSLPQSIRQATTFYYFKRELKTYFFKCANNV